MSFVISSLVVLHIVCWAIALGLWVAAIRTREPSPAIMHAAGGALVFGLIAMMLATMTGAGGHLWFTLKLLFAVVLFGAAFVAAKRQEQTPAPIWYAIPAATVINIIIAVFGIGR